MRRRVTVGALVVAVAGALSVLAQSRGAQLLVTSEPSGAAVEVDRRDVGTTPVRVSGLAPGDHAVVVAKDGYLENRRVVTVPESGAVEHRVVLVSLGEGPASTDGAPEDRPETSQTPGKKRSALWRKLRLAVPAAVAVVGGYAAYRVATRNGPPVAEIRGITPVADGLAGLTTFRFDGTSSSDPDDDALSYTWDFGDGQTGSGASATHIYVAAGQYSVTLTVSDGKHSAVASGRSVTVGELSASVQPASPGIAGLTSYRFEVSPSSDPDGDTLTFTWTLGDGTTASGSTATRVYARGGRFTPKVTARDPSSNEVAVTLDELVVRSMAGGWGGQISGFGMHVGVCMELEQEGTTITGSYTDDYGPGVVAGSIVAGPAISLTVTQPEYEPFIMQGAVTGDLTSSQGEVLNYFQGGAGQYVISRADACAAPAVPRDRTLRRTVR